MPVDASSIEPDNSVDATAKGGRKVRLRSLADIDRRTNAARLTFDLRARMIADLGGEDALSAMALEVIDNVAVMGAMLKDAAASYLSGEPTDIAEFTTLANAQRRLLADLGLERRQRDVTPTLRNYLAERQREKETAA